MRLRKSLGYFRIGAVAFLLVLAGASVALAQTGTGTLHGVVQDATGGLVANATVTVITPDGQTLPATTGRDGAFDVRNLGPGKYTVDVTAPGFAAFENGDVTITAGQTLQMTFELIVQAQTEQVTVSGDAPVTLDVSPSENASALVLTEVELAALPDDPDELLADLEALAGPSTGPNGGQLYIDGFTAGQLPPKSAIREIRINQNPFSAEYDKVGYGRIQIFTKPGTDKWHGQASINENNDIFNTKDPYTVTKSHFQSAQVSANIGGPLNKKTSFTLNMDYRNIQEPNVISAFTGQDAMGNPIPFSQVIPNPHTRLNIGPRLDYQLTKNNSISIRYQYFLNNQTNNGSGALNLASTSFNTSATEHTVQISDTQIISPKVINEIRFQYLNEVMSQNPISLVPTITVQGAFTGGGSNQGMIVDHASHYEFQNYTSIALAKHFIKFGGRLRLNTETNNSGTGFNGFFSFATLADFSAATPQPNLFKFTVGTPIASLSTEDTGLYVEDDWRVRPNLTLSAGLRFETQNHISNHWDWGPRIGVSYGIGSSKAPPKTVLRAGVGIFYDRFNAPQILQAERQGFGGPLQQQFIINSSPTTMALLANLYAECGTSLSAPGCPSPASIESSASTTPTFYQIAPNLHAPYTVQLAASVERQLTKTANLSVSYLHSNGYDQLDTDNINSPLAPGTLTPESPTNGGVYPNGVAENIYQYQSLSVFTQNQMIINVNIRAGAKLTLGGYYTLNYANSDSAGVQSFPSNPYNLMADYGRAAFDIRSRFYFGGTAILPWQLHVSPFILASSGSPYSITLNKDLIGSSITGNQRPAFSATCSGTNIVSTQFGCFNTDPGPGASLVPINSLTGQAHLTVNLRISRQFGFGKLPEPATNNRRGGGGGGGGGAPRGAAGGGGRGPAGPPGRGGGGGGAPRTMRYNFTVSANARNLFNVANLATPIGSINSPLFGQSDQLVGGAYSTVGANRQIFLELAFSF